MSEVIKKDGGGLRYSSGKTRHDLVPAFAQEQYARVLTSGTVKYLPRNWERGMEWKYVIGPMIRHIQAILRGEDFDPETGLLHSAHIMCNAAFLTEFYKIYPQGDDRPKVFLNMPKIGLDIDEVLCDWVGPWSKRFKRDVPNSWFFDRDIVKKFNKLKEDGKLEEFYANLPALIDPNDIPFEPHCYVTSRPVPQSVTEKWLDQHGFPARPVYTVGLGQSKVEVLKEAGVEVFVDDRYDNFVEVNNAGITCYLYDAPHNQRYDVGHLRIKHLADLVTSEHLTGLAMQKYMELLDKYKNEK